MDPSIHHLDQSTRQPTESIDPREPSPCARLRGSAPWADPVRDGARARSTVYVCLRASRSPMRAPSWPTPHEPTDPMWADQPCTLNHFVVRLVIFYKTSTILWKWTQSFFYSELDYFATLNSIVFCCSKLSHFMILSAILLQWTQPFYDFTAHFATLNLVILTTVLSHFMICQPFCYSARLFSKIVPSFLRSLQCSFSC
jgi:hypothetical protein